MPYQRAKNVAWRRIGGETVIVNLERRRMLALNDEGSAVWEALADSAEGDAALQARWGDSTGDETTSRFLADLEAEGVVERTQGDEVAEGSVFLPAAAVVAPAVVWREELNRFGGSCGLLPNQSSLCDQVSQNS